MPDVPVIRQQIVEALSSALRKGRHDLDVIPGLLRRAIKEEAWKERKEYLMTGKFVPSGNPRDSDFVIIPAFPSFRAFVEAKPPAGLGTNTDLIERIIRDDDETLVMFRRATVGKKGRPQAGQDNGSNRTIKPVRGTTRPYTLDRLKRNRADLFNRVVAGKLSANAAAIEAGFRKKPDRVEQMWRLWLKMSDDERAAFQRRTHGH